MSLQAFSPETELEHCKAREAEERVASAASSDAGARDCHLVMAERYADRAWSISEAHDLPYIPSDIWRGTDHSAKAVRS
jgi:hypothetical protein